jgi:uncharacterized protein YjbI with pentapeptide repeats
MLTPIRLPGADLSGQELSSRYLVRANLQGTQLNKAKLFLSDCSWANFSHANLSEADLSGANLTQADLREADLRQTNFLVADMHHAILIGADLRQARNLSVEQLHSAVYDETTLIDDALRAMPAFAQSITQKTKSISIQAVDSPTPSAAVIRATDISIHPDMISNAGFIADSVPEHTASEN